MEKEEGREGGMDGGNDVMWEQGKGVAIGREELTDLGKRWTPPSAIGTETPEAEIPWQP